MMIDAENIRKALSQTLPGAVSHAKMLPTNRTLIHPDDDDKMPLKQSSVLLLVYRENQELNVILIKRPGHMKYHPGQIALPGGRIEPGETALDTALRETYEEIGIKSEQIKILGSLSELYVNVSGFLIHPFVAWLDNKPECKINLHEVEKAISFPVKNLVNKIEETEFESVTGQIKVPCTKFEGEIIWGATAMILSEFIDVLHTISPNI